MAGWGRGFRKELDNNCRKIADALGIIIAVKEPNGGQWSLKIEDIAKRTLLIFELPTDTCRFGSCKLLRKLVFDFLAEKDVLDGIVLRSGKSKSALGLICEPTGVPAKPASKPKKPETNRKTKTPAKNGMSGFKKPPLKSREQPSFAETPFRRR